MKKVLSIILVLALALTMLQIGAVTASAADSDFIYGPDVYSNGVIIYGYTGTEGNVVIPNQLGGKPVTGISNKAFYNCSILTSLTIPDSLTMIDTDPFHGCSNLANFIVGSGNSAFSVQDGVLFDKKKTKLIKYLPNKSGSYNIPGGVATIETGAFWDCVGLTAIDVPASVTDFGDSYFMGCTALTQININASNNYYTSVDGVMFDKSKSYLIQYPTARSGSYIIPSGVLYISNEAFGLCTGLTNVTIPNSVTNILGYAFSGCSGLANISIPDSVKSMGVYSFYNCTALKSISIGKGASDLAAYVFLGCPALTQFTVSADNPSYSSQDGVLFDKYKTSIICYPFAKAGYYNIPTSVTKISSEAFCNCNALTGITFPDSVTEIGDGAFENCTSLITVPLPNSLTSIYYDSFKNCTSLSSVIIPASVTSIQYGAFTGCKTLKEIIVDLNNSKYSSQDGVLFNKDKTKLEKYPEGKSGNTYTIPTTVTYIGVESFRGSSGLTSVTIPSRVTTIATEAFCDCTGLSSIIIPDSVNGIGYNAFEGCTALSTVVLGNGIVNISDNLFFGCTSLTKISIPASVIMIGGYAFSGCSSLVSAYFMGNMPSKLGNSVFQHCAVNFKVYYISGKTGFGSTMCGYPVTTFIPLTAPAGLTLNSKTKTTAEISWSAVADATGYELYSGTTKLATVLTTNYSVIGLSPGIIYNFTVRAVNDTMESPFTAPLSVITESIPGDVNGSGIVDLMDVTTLSRHVAGWTGLQVQEAALDVTGDGKVDLADVTLLSRFVAGWNVTIH